MSDATLRELERQWRERGDPELGARWLLARLRAGTLDPERLPLLAHCGFEPARRVLREREGGDPLESPSETAEWFRTLPVREKTPLVVLALAAAREARAVWTEARVAGESLRDRLVAGEASPLRTLVPGYAEWEASRDEPAAQVAAAEAWLTCPCEVHREAAHGPWVGAWSLLAAFGAAAAAARAAAAPSLGHQSTLAALGAIADAAAALPRPEAASLAGIEWSFHATGVRPSALPPHLRAPTIPALHAALQRALTEWALG